MPHKEGAALKSTGSVLGEISPSEQSTVQVQTPRGFWHMLGLPEALERCWPLPSCCHHAAHPGTTPSGPEHPCGPTPARSSGPHWPSQGNSGFRQVPLVLPKCSLSQCPLLQQGGTASCSCFVSAFTQKPIDRIPSLCLSPFSRRKSSGLNRMPQ